jgi:hypothetical protein
MPYKPKPTNYTLVGRIAVPCLDMEQWVLWMGTETEKRRVAETTIGPLFVSTVFLGLDHGFGRPEPLLFETMVFGAEESSEHVDIYMDRYHTWDEAEKGHARAVEWVRNLVSAATL